MKGKHSKIDMDPNEYAIATDYMRNHWPNIGYSIKDLANMRVSFAHLLRQTKYSEKTLTDEWKKTRETLVNCFESAATDHGIVPGDPTSASTLAWRFLQYIIKRTLPVRRKAMIEVPERMMN